MKLSLQPVEDAPSDWIRLPLQAIGHQHFERNKGLRNENLLSLSYGLIKNKDIESNEGLLPESFETYQLVQPGDIIFRFTDLQNDLRSLRSAIVTEPGIITSAYLCFRPNPKKVSPQYLNYLMRAYDLAKVFYAFGGGVRQSLKYDEVRNLPIALPPRPEQDAIVDFLDQELQEVDALQVRNTRLLQQLGVRRESLISSFIEEKNGDWPWVPLKYRVVLNPDVLPEDTDPNEVLNYIEIGDVNLEQGISGFTPVAFSEAPSRARRLVRNGDVLISTVRTYLKAIGQVKEPQGDNKIVASTGFAVLRPDRIDPRFLKYAVSSDTFIQNIQAYSTGISYPAISSSQLVKFKIPVPPIALQVEIADDLDRHLASIDKLQEQTTNLVLTLQERRSSIISSAVTGQIDVTRRA